MIIAYILLGVMCLVLVAVIVRTILVVIYFKRGHNPYTRICKKCGSHQVMFQSNIEGCEDDTWWETMNPIGSDPKCLCNLFAEYR